MTTAIDANGNTVSAPSSNLRDDDSNPRTFVRDVQAEKVAAGHYSQASNFIEDARANNNPEIVTRHGSRIYAHGDYRPNDLVMIDGMEVTYELAASLGLIKGEYLTTPSDDFMSNAENNRAELQEAQQRQDNRTPQVAQLLSDQLELAVGDAAPAALETFGRDIVANGTISEHGLQYAREKLGMSEDSVQQIFSDMQDAGSQVLSEFMEVGDGLGGDRMAFLMEKAWNGTQQEQEIVRNLWFMAATGKLNRDRAAEAFDYLFKPYRQEG